MPDATLADCEALAGAVISGEYPILPKPEWGQDAAYIAFVLDRTKDTADRLFNAVVVLLDAAQELGFDDSESEDAALHRRVIERALNDLGPDLHKLVRAAIEARASGADR